MTDEAKEDISQLRLGDITYSNCFPVHARLIHRRRDGDPRLVHGIPSLLNRLLAEREIDVAPSSSIEFARHPGQYHILPELVIGSRGPVRSIQLISRRNPTELDGHVVAIPTASATSVVLLKILLSVRWGVTPEYTWFDQEKDNPYLAGADAALFIGDVALRPGLHERMTYRFDLGEVWFRATGLPFAFAVWQASGGSPGQLSALRETLVASRAWFERHQERLAREYSARFKLPARLLAEYWGSLEYQLDDTMVEGLRTFYRLAREIGEIDEVPELTWA